MNALVGYGVSSESEDSDRDASDEHSPIRSSGQEECQEPVKKSRNFLLETESASSDSDPEEEKHLATKDHLNAPAQTSLPTPDISKTNKLPPPSLLTCSDSSVFSNPFKAQADQKLCALQKHVPLTEQAKPSHIGGRRVCVSYRKDGRCRFGIKCKFAHDSDLQTPVPPSDCQPKDTPLTHAGGSQSVQPGPNEEQPEEQSVKKRRVGLSNTLIPPKRAMKQYVKQRGKDFNVL